MRDSGIGILPSKLETIFAKFSQADTSITRKYGGTGLGLSITKSPVELIGGDIHAESEPGKGSTFTITLPFQRSTLALAAGKSLANDWAEVSDAGRSFNSRFRILLVEDFDANVLVASSMLTRLGYRVSIVQNGSESLTKVKAEPFDLILMDVQMPVMDGYKATEAIRAEEQSRRARGIPIIGMPAHALQGDRGRCLKAGMNDYIAKPFDPAALLTMLTKYLRTGEATDEIAKMA